MPHARRYTLANMSKKSTFWKNTAKIVAENFIRYQLWAKIADTSMILLFGKLIGFGEISTRAFQIR